MTQTIRILFVGVNPDDTIPLDLSREVEAIETKLLATRFRHRFELRQRWRTEAHALPGLLMEYKPQILHFSGHGAADGRLYFRGPGGEALAADKQTIADVFRVLDGIRCVVINACHSSGQAELIAEHVDAVVGMSRAIDDAGAIGFSAGFYQAIGYGESLNQAFELGCIQARLSTDRREDPCQLHMRSSGMGRLSLVEGDGSGSSADHADAARLAEDDKFDGRYRLIERVGSGSYASVWKARDLVERRTVALKFLHAEWSSDRERVARFVGGGVRMGALSHHAIAELLAFPRQSCGHTYFALPWYPQGDLEQGIRRGTVASIDGLRVVADVLDGLAHAHAHGLVHRDVKPANILIDGEGRGVLTDFDLARSCAQGQGTVGGLGTFAYAAPEQQIDAAAVDARADIYSAGMCTIFVLAGEQPKPLEAAYKPETVLPMLGCGEQLRAVLTRAVTVSPAERTATCRELAAALRAEVEQRVARPHRGVQQPPSPAARARVQRARTRQPEGLAERSGRALARLVHLVRAWGPHGVVFGLVLAVVAVILAKVFEWLG